uniref:Uncharacterized protein n=1 Tax=Arundo donax TaxID=35708 RepID=A0A0A9EV65_ARUDO
MRIASSNSTTQMASTEAPVILSVTDS